jgi:hypothetical protein
MSSSTAYPVIAHKRALAWTMIRRRTMPMPVGAARKMLSSNSSRCARRMSPGFSGCLDWLVMAPPVTDELLKTEKKANPHRFLTILSNISFGSKICPILLIADFDRQSTRRGQDTIADTRTASQSPTILHPSSHGHPRQPIYVQGVDKHRLI